MSDENDSGTAGSPRPAVTTYLVTPPPPSSAASLAGILHEMREERKSARRWRIAFLIVALICMVNTECIKRNTSRQDTAGFSFFRY